MIHKGTKIIYTDRLVLRRFEMGDADKMYSNWASNPKVTKFLTWHHHKSVEETRSVLSRWVSSYDDLRFYQWAIVLKDTLEPIGSISVVKVDDDIDEVEVGYCIGEAWWGFGYTAEALRGVIDYLFLEVKPKKIRAKHDSDNPNSGRVMQKCGLTYDKTLYKAGKNISNPKCDLVLYSISAK